MAQVPPRLTQAQLLQARNVDSTTHVVFPKSHMRAGGRLFIDFGSEAEANRMLERGSLLVGDRRVFFSRVPPRDKRLIVVSREHIDAHTDENVRDYLEKHARRVGRQLVSYRVTSRACNFGLARFDKPLDDADVNAFKLSMHKEPLLGVVSAVPDVFVARYPDAIVLRDLLPTCDKKSIEEAIAMTFVRGKPVEKGFQVVISASENNEALVIFHDYRAVQLKPASIHIGSQRVVVSLFRDELDDFDYPK